MTQTDPAFGISTENVDDALRRQLETAGFGVQATEPETPPPAPAPTEPETPPAAEVAPVLTLSDGRTIDLETAQRFADFEANVMTDPRFLRAYQEAFTDAATVPAPVPAPAPAQADHPGLPPELADQLAVDPVARYLYDQTQAQQKTIAEMRAAQEQLSSGFTTIEQRNAMGLVNQARTNFMREKGLDTADMDRVYQFTLDAYDLDRLIAQPLNPATRQAESPDPVRRLEDAFGWAYHAIPEFRERDFSAREEAQKADTERKAKLTALSTSGSSAPPPTPSPAPGDLAGRREALARDVALAMSGNMIQPE